jgi:hypothetical protein
MSYVNAPSTKMLATHCAICSRPLRDAQSVEVGIGPICRERVAAMDKLSEDTRVAVNKFLYEIALLISTPGGFDHRRLMMLMLCLQRLGAVQIAQKVLAGRSKLAPIKVLVDPQHPRHFALDIKGLAYRLELLEKFSSVKGYWLSSSDNRWGARAGVAVFPRAHWLRVLVVLMAEFHNCAVADADKNLRFLSAELDPGFEVPELEADDERVGPPPLRITIVDAEATFDRYLRSKKPKERFGIDTPYDAGVVQKFRGIRRRRWDGIRKVNTFDRDDLATVLSVVRECWPEAQIVNESGHFYAELAGEQLGLAI